MEIAERARRHGIADADMRHAVRHPIFFYEEDPIVMVVGAATDGRLLEVGVLDTRDGPLIVHAMSARNKYLR
ncbi:MAG: hypothetical protein ACRDU0_07650 [Mycobacterium sp.]